jgi:hypothetical protein
LELLSAVQIKARRLQSANFVHRSTAIRLLYFEVTVGKYASCQLQTIPISDIGIEKPFAYAVQETHGPGGSALDVRSEG